MNGHHVTCECDGEGLLPIDQRDGHGRVYLAWQRCPGTGRRYENADPGPVMSWPQFTAKHPNWKEELR